MSEFAPTKRVIIIAAPSDFKQCLRIAEEAMRLGDVGERFGYWSQRDPDFSAVVRVNKASVSVNAKRRVAEDTSHAA